MIELLRPLFPGALAPLAQRLHAGPAPGGAWPGARLLEPAQLEDLLRRYAAAVWGLQEPAAKDLRAASSAWVLDTLGVLVPPVAAAASVLGQVFPVGLEGLHLDLAADGRVRGMYLDGIGTALPGAPAAQRYAPLVWQHWAPLFAALEQVARVPQKVLWSNAARHLEAVLEQAVRLAPQQPTIAQDAADLLQAPLWPAAGGPRANPLCRPRRVVAMATAQGTEPVALHRECCLYYRLPGEGYCGRCPLDPRHRAPPAGRRPDACADTPDAAQPAGPG